MIMNLYNFRRVFKACMMKPAFTHRMSRPPYKDDDPALSVIPLLINFSDQPPDDEMIRRIAKQVGIGYTSAKAYAGNATRHLKAYRVLKYLGYQDDQVPIWFEVPKKRAFTVDAAWWS